jgi:putative PIN family toxin of toxin-antitoxin system
MRAVVDTNVLVSALINTSGAPAQIVEAIRVGTLRPVVSTQVLLEYGDVLRRPRFAFPRDLVDALLADMAALALILTPDAIDPARLPDAGDAPFIALARFAACPIVTGNVRHFPSESGVKALTPAECLGKLT